MKAFCLGTGRVELQAFVSYQVFVFFNLCDHHCKGQKASRVKRRAEDQVQVRQAKTNKARLFFSPTHSFMLEKMVDIKQGGYGLVKYSCF